MLSYRRTLIAIVATIFLVSLLRLHGDTTVFVDRLYNRPSTTTDISVVPAHIDATYEPHKNAHANTPSLDIVVSMYKEDTNKTLHTINELKALEPLQNLTITTYIYTKDVNAKVDELREIFNTTHVSILRNVGREAGTYFTHILKEWDNLGRHTLFIQAEMHEFEAAKNRLSDWFEPDTGVLSLGQVESCDCVKCTDFWDSGRTFPRIEELYSALNGEFCPKKIAISYLGQIMVSAARIYSRGPSTYKYLKSVLEADMEHFIHSDPRQDMFKDETSNP
jgi:hypothetical protein